MTVRGIGEITAAVIGVVLAAVATASLAAFLGWQTAAPLPENGEARRIAGPALPAQPTDPRRLEPAFAAGNAGQDWRDLLLGVDDYRPGSVHWTSTWPSRASAATAVSQARADLRLAGWQVGAIQDSDCCPRFVAHQDEWRVVVESQGLLDDQRASVQTSVTRTPPHVVTPLTIAGALLGGLAGWWLTAVMARRLRSRPPTGRLLVAGLFTAGATALLPATAVSTLALGQSLAAPGEPMPVWIGYTFVILRTGALTGAALMVAAATALASTRPAQR
ncbi:hypothetical protein [Micromonospora echinospora]|uniref:hypothetical protein n=1 Tax=Micromonospora echinospora TaxID=1877 RepID=UPI00117E65D7|nr:hypothetical protein [Micromonospora echinospora]